MRKIFKSQGIDGFDQTLDFIVMDNVIVLIYVLVSFMIYKCFPL